MSFNKTDRIFYYDLIRFLAIFGVLACHVFASLVVKTEIFGTKLWYFSLFLNCLRDISVPLFIALSGALLISKKEPILIFVKKRLKKVVIPYIFWMTCFIIFAIICIHYNYYFISTVDHLISSTVSINPSGYGEFFWFVPLIITVYLIIIIINKLSEYNNNFLKLSLIISIFLVLTLNATNNYFNKPLSYIFYAIFAIFGYYLARIDLINNPISKSLNITNEKLTIIFLILSLTLYLTEIYFNGINSILLNGVSSMPQLSLLNISAVISIFLFFRYFSQSKGKIGKIFSMIKNSFIGTIILSISICSYGIYLCHFIVKLSIQYLIMPIKECLPISVYTTFLLIATLLISWALIWIMSKIPILKIVSGK